MPLPIPFYLRLNQSNALTHGELDGNLRILSQKIDNTVGQNIGSGGVGLYINKNANPNDGFLNFRTLAGGGGVKVFVSGDSIMITGHTAPTIDINVTGGTYSPDTGCATFYTNTSSKFEVCDFITGFTDSYTDEASLSGTSIVFDNTTKGSNFYNVDLWPLLSGFTTDYCCYWTAGTGTNAVKLIDNFSTASGNYSVAEGTGTTAAGNYSHAEGENTIASGRSSHAEGGSTLASGIASHAEGGYDKDSGFMGTSATGDSAHAEGFNTLAGGTASHAEGIDTSAGGDSSHAEGKNTSASAEQSHAEGDDTSAMGVVSHAEGGATHAFGEFSHSEGKLTIARGKVSHAEGYITRASGFSSHAEGQLTIASGVTSHSQNYRTVAQGDYTHAGGKGADIIGTGGGAVFGRGHVVASGRTTFVHYEQTDYLFNNIPPVVPLRIGALGDNSAILGGLDHRTEKTAQRSVVLGGDSIIALSADTVYVPRLNIEQPLSTTAIKSLGIDINGFVTTATTSASTFNWCDPIVKSGNTWDCCIDLLWVSTISGCSPVTIGSSIQSTTSSGTGNNSIAYGLQTLSSGEYSFSHGWGTIASGHSSHAEGGFTIAGTTGGTIAGGNGSHAEGSFTKAYGNSSHAEGTGTLATGHHSHAEGQNTRAKEQNSHAEGEGTLATGMGAHAEGHQTSATTNYSHTEGTQTIATGTSSHAEGFITATYGDYSHSEGSYTQASGINSHSGGMGKPDSKVKASGQASFAHYKITDPDLTFGVFSEAGAILGGKDHDIQPGSSYSIIGGGSAHHISGTSLNSGIIAGIDNTITSVGAVSTTYSAIIGGDGNKIVATQRSVILGGLGITATVDDAAYVPKLNIGEPLVTPSQYNLGIDSDGFVTTGTTGGGGTPFDWCDPIVKAGNTSGCCIDVLWVTTVSGCSPLYLGGANRTQGVQGNVNVDGILNIKNPENAFFEEPNTNWDTPYILVWNPRPQWGDKTPGDVEYVHKKLFWWHLRPTLLPEQEVRVPIAQDLDVKETHFVYGVKSGITITVTTADTETNTTIKNDLYRMHSDEFDASYQVGAGIFTPEAYAPVMRTYGIPIFNEHITSGGTTASTYSTAYSTQQRRESPTNFSLLKMGNGSCECEPACEADEVCVKDLGHDLATGLCFCLQTDFPSVSLIDIHPEGGVNKKPQISLYNTKTTLGDNTLDRLVVGNLEYPILDANPIVVPSIYEFKYGVAVQSTSGVTTATTIMSSSLITVTKKVGSSPLVKSTIGPNKITTGIIQAKIISATTIVGGGCCIDCYENSGTGTTINWNVSGTSTNYETTLDGASILNLFNVACGNYGTIIIHQDATGGRTLSLGTINGSGGIHKVVNGGDGVPTLTTNPFAIDILSFTYNGSAAYWTVGNDYT